MGGVGKGVVGGMEVGGLAVVNQELKALLRA